MTREITRQLSHVFTLTCCQVFFGTDAIPTVSVEITNHERKIRDAATGKTVEDALYQAIFRTLGIEGRVIHESIFQDPESRIWHVALVIKFECEEKGNSRVGEAGGYDFYQTKAYACLAAVNKYRVKDTAA